MSGRGAGEWDEWEDEQVKRIGWRKGRRVEVTGSEVTAEWNMNAQPAKLNKTTRLKFKTTMRNN